MLSMSDKGFFLNLFIYFFIFFFLTPTAVKGHCSYVVTPLEQGDVDLAHRACVPVFLF